MILRKVALIDTIGDGGDMGAADAYGKECQVTFDMGGKGSDIQQGDDISGRISEPNNGGTDQFLFSNT